MSEKPPSPPGIDHLSDLPADELIDVLDEAMAGLSRYTAYAIRALREIEGRAVPVQGSVFEASRHT